MPCMAVLWIFMVASFSALGGKNPQPDCAGIAEYFAGVDYYAGRSGVLSEWLGTGSAALGLAGQVHKWQFNDTLAGIHPFSKKQLVQIQRQRRDENFSGVLKYPDDPDNPSGGYSLRQGPKRRDRNPGVDVCLTPSKSVSAFIAVLPEPLREKFLAVIDQVARETILLAQTDLLLGRSGKGGWRKENPRLVISMFRELVNRNGEPNLHYHCVISNLALYKDLKWRTINTAKLRDWVRTLSPIFASSLAKELRSLGLELEQGTKANGEKAPWFEIKGVPKELRKYWSSRRTEIEVELARHGETLESASGKARQAANLATRNRKEEVVADGALFARWQREAAEHGFTPELAEQLVGKSQETEFELAYAKGWNAALQTLQNRGEKFAERHLIQLVCEEVATEGADGAEIARRVRQDMRSSRKIVSRGLYRGEEQFAIGEDVEMEERSAPAAESKVLFPKAIVQGENPASDFGGEKSAPRKRSARPAHPGKPKNPPPPETEKRPPKPDPDHGIAPKRAKPDSSLESVLGTEATYAQAFAAAIAALSREHAYFSTGEVTRLVLAALPEEGVIATQVARRIKQDLRNSAEIVPRGELRSEQQFTTRENWELEKDLIKTIDVLRSRSGASVKESVIQVVLQNHKHLGPEQQRAARELLTANSAIRPLTSVANADVSSVIKPVAEALMYAGYQPIGGAILATAKEKLAVETGIPSRTVNSYLWHLERSLWGKIRDRSLHAAKQIFRAALGKSTYAPHTLKFDARTVLFLSECAMLDTRTLLALVRQVVKAGGTIIPMGDPAHLPPLLAGGPLKHLIGKAGQVHLAKNEAQQNFFDQKAAADLRAGRSHEALANYSERGLLRIGKNHEDAIQQLVSHWSQQGGSRDPASHMIYTQTKAEALALNRACQQERQRLGAVSSWGGIKISGERIFSGDHVLIRKPLRKYGVENGQRATVVAINPILRTITLWLDHDPVNLPGQKPRNRKVTIPLRKIPKQGLTLGMAATASSMPTHTCDHAYALLASRNLQSREMAYVQATRGRLSTTLFSTSKIASELASLLKRSVAKDLAHDLPDPPRPSSGLTLRPDLLSGP